MYLISSIITTITNGFSVPSMDIMGMPSCLYLAYPPCSKFTVSQCKREMKKIVRTNVILCVCPEIHSTLIIEAMAAWPTLIGRYCPRTILSTLLPPSSYREVTQCHNTRPKGEVLMHFMFLSQKKHSTGV